MTKHDLIIIGGGPAGLIAAMTAKDMGTDTAILEGNDRIGKKILITGNGRCNVTNKYLCESKYHSKNPEFFKTVLKTFTVEDTINLFSSLGLPLITLEDGKMYPMSLQASSVLDILRFSIADKNIPVYYDSKVKAIKRKKTCFQIKTKDEKNYECKRIILATGGKSAPATGSDGSGFEVAKTLGHNIITPLPSLVQLKLAYKHLKALSGVKFNGFVEICVDNVSKKIEFGEILFTDYGISGPPVLQISRIASCSLSKGKKTTLKIDMFCNMKEDELRNFLSEHLRMVAHRSIYDAFNGIINKKIIPVLLKEACVSDMHKPCSDLDRGEKENIYKLLKSWEFVVTDTNSFNNSQVTAGGIDTKQVSAKTLQSEIIPGLYFAGEILDVDGDCGGFNLQWAWGSGFIAGKSASGNNAKA